MGANPPKLSFKLSERRKETVEKSDIIKALSKNKRGTFQTVTIRRQAETYKRVKETVSKRSTFQRMERVSYAKRFAVRIGVALGLRKPPQLPEWAKSTVIDGVRFIQHKETGEVYLPLDLEGMEPIVEWFLDGVPVSKAHVEPLLTAKERVKKPTKAELHSKFQERHILVKLANIESLG